MRLYYIKMNEEQNETIRLLNLVCEGVEQPTDEQEQETIDYQTEN
jgi:hypothetical protein